VDSAAKPANPYRLAPAGLHGSDTMPDSAPNHPADSPPGGGGGRSPGPGQYQPRVIKPRKVRGGLKFVAADTGFASSWTAQRWLRLVEAAAPGDNMAEGLWYAREGQTRRLAIEPGKIKAAVQGSIISSYDSTITLPTFTHEQSERLIGAMVDQAVYAAKLLAGELPPNIEDAFGALDLKLFPAEARELVASCNCRAARGTAAPLPSSPPIWPPPSRPRTEIPGAGRPGSAPASTRPLSPSPPFKGQAWCKHACCAAWLVAERFTADPFLIFTLRGLPREELLERLRQRRLVAGSGGGSALIYSPMIPGISDQTSPPLDESLTGFWEGGPGLKNLDLPITPSEVSHPLLRRLGPSPFSASGGRFPLVGLLATAYGMVSGSVLNDVEGGPDPGNGPNGK
jgi:uncharacterized Zn finger protein